MEALRSMAVFAAVIEHGSMNAAGRALGMTASAVSQHVRRLEQQHQVALLHRTTRKLTLTEAGSVFYRSCAAMLAAQQEATRQMAALRDEPVGELRMAAPSGFAGGVLGEALAPLLAAHPGLSLRLFFQDEMIDLVQQRIDLALRAGIQPDSTLVARHLADWPFVLVAAPAYLAARGVPQQPAQLYQHDWIGLAQDHGLAPLLLKRGSQQERLSLSCRIASNSMLSARAFALAGLGIALQPAPEVRAELAAGRLLQLLPEWQAPALPVYAVTPRRDVQPAKVREAVACLRQAWGC